MEPKTLKIKIIKKNRKYFAAENDNGYKCKILIDSNSESLERGEHFLALDDISVRSRYGTDLIYKLKASAEEQAEQGITSLRAEYNSILVDECRNLGGTWDKSQDAWIFPAYVESEVESLDEIFNSDPIVIEITAIEEIYEYGKGIEFLGKPLCRAFERDSGARISTDIALLSGYATSGGSRKNWATILDEGTVLRLQIPSKLIELRTDERFEIKVIK